MPKQGLLNYIQLSRYFSLIVVSAPQALSTLSFLLSAARFFFFNSHSQIRRTVQPLLSKIFVTVLSRSTLSLIFFAQKSSLSLGFVFRQSWPCQKHPSTNTAILSLRKTKSGCPLTGYPRRQPFKPCSRKIAISANSVDLLPFPLMFRITAERFSVSYTSAIRCTPLSCLKLAIRLSCRTVREFLRLSEYRRMKAEPFRKFS